MKNNLIRKVLWLSLAISLIYTVSTILGFYVTQHVPESQISVVVDSTGNHSLKYGYGVDTFRRVNLGVQTVLTLPLYPLYILGEFGFAIMVGYIGPILIFIFWFIILYILGLIYTRLPGNSAQTINSASNGKIATFCVIGIILLSFVQYWYQASSERESFGPQNAGKIVSIAPQNAQIGDTVRIVLSEADHEGYSYVSLIKYLGPGEGHMKKGTVWIGKIPENNTITFVLKSKNCFDSVLDESCDLFVDAVPDMYKLRIQSPGDSVLLESDFRITQ